MSNTHTFTLPDQQLPSEEFVGELEPDLRRKPYSLFRVRIDADPVLLQ